MGYQDQTDMGGRGGTFLTTHWSLIENVKSEEDPDKVLIGTLLKRYWKPVYCYLRRKGYKNEQAKDLAQGFFHEVVLNRNLVQRAEQSKGRFRSFLLHTLNQYLINQQRKQAVKSRIPEDKLVSLDAMDMAVLPRTIADSAPEDSYNYAWLSALLDQALSEVQAECCAKGLETHWSVFHERVVRPILHNSVSPPLAEICRKYDIDDEKKAANMTVTVKRRFRKVLKRLVRTTVASDTEVDKELEEITQYLPESAQRF
ncbi:MAG: sigma-70 family RNA polymerase sigma factor [Phycisphaerales bacterium]|nr:MAG: sigma-70 family RNA polymerase sigma factor [Phycisphaerales bacterium]